MRWGPASRVRQPTLFAMGALDDWTPVSQCQAVIDRIAQGRDLVETKVYEGAHHSFDALGLPVRYLDGVGNRSKPGGCCGAHYGAHEPAWKQFVARRAGVPGEDVGALTSRLALPHRHVARRQDRAGRRLVRLAGCPIRRRSSTSTRSSRRSMRS